MKALYLSVLISFLTSSSFSQQKNNENGNYPRWQITTGIGGLVMTNMPSGIDQQICLGVKFDAGYNLLLSGKHYLSVGLGYENNVYIVDGYFTKNNDKYNFSVTPDNYKQHAMSLHYLNVPILYILLVQIVNIKSAMINLKSMRLLKTNSAGVCKENGKCLIFIMQRIKQVRCLEWGFNISYPTT